MFSALDHLLEAIRPTTSCELGNLFKGVLLDTVMLQVQVHGVLGFFRGQKDLGVHPLPPSFGKQSASHQAARWTAPEKQTDAAGQKQLYEH